MIQNQLKPIRLHSLDALRGFDMFVLVLLHPFILALAKVTPDCAFTQFLHHQSTHVAWEGFTFHDLIMPLFMFVSGVAIPFAFAKFRISSGKFNFDSKRMYKRMGRRVLLLWLLGMVIQGNLLGLDPQNIFLYTNTLQAIAIGYLFASLLYIYFSWKIQIGIAVALLAIYWLVMTCCSSQGWGVNFGDGSYVFPNNMAEYIDRVVLGRFRDGVSWENGGWSFSTWYGYTWILSSLTFIVTTMTGIFAGEILLMSRNARQALLRLIIFGGTMLVGAWILSHWIPIVKTIWTPSMVLLSSGWSILLLALFYWLVDICGLKRWVFPFRVIGLNAIVAYALGEYFNFSGITDRVLYGVGYWLPEGWYSVVLAIGNSLLIYWVIWMLYRNKRFIKL